MGIRRKAITVFGLMGTVCWIIAMLTVSLVFIKEKFTNIPLGTLFVPCYHIL